MLLLSGPQIQQWDAFTMQQEPVASIDLMERAAQSCVDWIAENILKQGPFRIFCGKGNNGGDGLAIARLLLEKGYQVAVYILEFGARGTDDFQLNLHRLHQLTREINFIQSAEYFPDLTREDIIIDALYGSGLNRPLQLLNKELVEHINRSRSVVISIDVPSGMAIDRNSKSHPVIRAKYTLTFQSLKLCFLIAENAAYFGRVQILNIGLDPGFLDNVETVYQMINRDQVLTGLHERKDFAHKGHYGHALLIAGSKGKTGAALLAARACLRTGAGLLTVSLPEETHQTLNQFLPEAMTADRNAAIAFEKFNVIGIGPGLGTEQAVYDLLVHVFECYSKPVVLDADALNMMAAYPELLSKVPEGSILSPHPKEFDRIAGDCENEYERLDKAIHLSRQYPIVVVLKGHHTLIAAGGRGYFNITGNAGMAKGGSGDVLTGMITALLAQGYEPLHAAKTGVYLHGLAGDLALENQSMESLLATDLIENIGKAYHYIRY